MDGEAASRSAGVGRAHERWAPFLRSKSSSKWRNFLVAGQFNGNYNDPLTQPMAFVQTCPAFVLAP